MTGPGHPKTFDDKEEYGFLPEQLNTYDRFRWIQDFLRRKGEISNEGLREYIYTLLPRKRGYREDAVRLLLSLTVDDVNNEEKRRISRIWKASNAEIRRIIKRIRKVCASI